MSSLNNEPTIDQLNNEISTLKASIETPSSAAAAAPEPSWWSVSNAMTISMSVLLFGLIISIIAAALIKNGKNSDSVLRTLGTITIIISALFLVVAGYSDKQISPVIGLLGTIAGYILGKSNSESKP